MIEIRHEQMDKTSDTQEAYNFLYREKGIQQRESFYMWLINLLRPTPNSILLDISCGQGRLVNFAKRRGLRAIGMDFAADAVKMSFQSNPMAGWSVADGEHLPLNSQSIDYVTHIGSLEHYQNPTAGIREIARVLKSNGTACILLPNTYGLFGNILNVVRTGEVFDDGQPLQRYNSRKGWEKLIIDNGLNPFRVIKYEREWPQTKTDLFWYLAHPSKMGRLLISYFVPVNLANCIVYLCKPN
jgi:SAM-dependent methyltransferase